MRKLLAAFCVMISLVGLAAAGGSPSLSDPSPADQTTGVTQDSNLSIKYTDPDGDTGDVTFYDGSGVMIAEDTAISDGSRASVDPSIDYGENVEWYAVASDGENKTTSSNYSFTVTKELLYVEDQVVDGVYKSDPFTAKTLGDLTVEASIDSDESLEAEIIGYNSTDSTLKETYTVTDGSNTYDPPETFTENTTTYVVELNASDGSVTVSNLRQVGTTENNKVSGVAPGGGLITGNFFGIPSFVDDLFGGLFEFLGGLIP